MHLGLVHQRSKTSESGNLPPKLRNPKQPKNNLNSMPPAPLSSPLCREVFAAILLHHPFTYPPSRGVSASSLLLILSSIPSFLLLPPRSAARQPLSSRRHRSPLRPHLPYAGPTTAFDPDPLIHSSLRFFFWAHTYSQSPPSDISCRAMARILARARNLSPLWGFLKHQRPVITTATLTDVINTLGHLGRPQQALALFHRMRQLHCKPDVQSYNTTISALCWASQFKKARFLLGQMELPGAKCPPDLFTYTIFITHYCKHSTHTGCRKAIRRRIWEANHMFRHMIFKGFKPDVVTYNCLIDGLCKTYRIDRARELFDEMIEKGCLPNRVTYNSFVRYYSVVNEVDKAVEMMRMMVREGHGVPTCSSYTPIIHSLCESGRGKEAGEFLVEMVEGGSTPREFTYRMVCEGLRSKGEEGLPRELCRRVECAMDERHRRMMQVKPVMRRRHIFIRDDETVDECDC